MGRKPQIDWNSEETFSILSNPNMTLKEKSKLLNGISIWYLSRKVRSFCFNVKSNRKYHIDKAATNKERKQRYNAKSRKTPYKGKVLQLDKERNLIKMWEHTTDAAKELGLSAGGIYACLRGFTKTSGGYKWKYELG